MKKLSIILLALILSITMIANTYALDFKITTGLAGKDTGIATVAYNISPDFTLRTGLGVTIKNSDPFISLGRIGLKFNPLWGLYIDCDFSSTYSDTTRKSTSLFDSYKISLKKSFDFSITPEFSVGVSLALLSYSRSGATNSINILSAIEPTFGFKITI
ncbi:MAG: hypothetical protein WC860_04280 [Candidatus Margulisiibacteriota bacterium]|jgi:hypothetical protein